MRDGPSDPGKWGYRGPERPKRERWRQLFPENSEEGTSKGGPLTRVAKAFSFAKAVDLPEARGPLALVQAWNWGGIDY